MKEEGVRSGEERREEKRRENQKFKIKRNNCKEEKKYGKAPFT